MDLCPPRSPGGEPVGLHATTMWSILPFHLTLLLVDKYSKKIDILKSSIPSKALSLID